MKITFLTLLVAAAFVAESKAQLFTYNFNDVNFSSQSAGGTASNLTFSSFTANTGAVGSWSGSSLFVSDWPTGAVNGSNTFSGAISLGDYLSFTITPQAGFVATFTSISFNVVRNDTGPRNYVVRSSLDGFASNLSASVGANVTNRSVVGDNVFQTTDTNVGALGNPDQITLGSGFSGLTAPVTFRVYGYNSETIDGRFGVDNVATFGSVTAVPEPATYGALFAAALALFVGARVWRRKDSRSLQVAGAPEATTGG